jgi:putative copper resistance protein D
VVVAVVGTAATRDPTVAGIGSAPWIVGFGIPVLRTLLDLGAVAVAGLSLLSMMIGFDTDDRPAAGRAAAAERPVAAHRTEAILGRARRLSVWASALWGSCALLSIVLLSIELEPEQALSPASIWRYVTDIASGKGLLISAGSALLSMWLCRLSVKHGENVPAELRIGVALFGLLPLPLTGHAADWDYHDLSMLSMELHVVAATAWAGGLAAVVVFLARQPALLAVALPRFSKLATWCVFVVGVTGIFNGVLELALSPITSLPGSLFTTRYGVLLIAKAACMTIVAGLAIHVRRRILPRVAGGRSTTIAVWCGVEILVLAAAFGVAVVLTRSSVTPF